MRRAAAVLAAAAGFVVQAPGVASAAPLATVEVGFVFAGNQGGDGGSLAAAVCRAVARPAEPEVVPVATEVTCTAGPSTRTTTVPGAVAVTTVAAAAPIEICVAGTAVFVDLATDDLFTVTAGPSCVVAAG